MFNRQLTVGNQPVYGFKCKSASHCTTGNNYRAEQQNFYNLLPLEIKDMFESYENKKRKQVSLMRSIMDYGMGILLIIVGVFFLFHQQLKIDIGYTTAPTLEKFFGAICLLYGGWRIYRGYKKNYFK